MGPLMGFYKMGQRLEYWCGFSVYFFEKTLQVLGLCGVPSSRSLPKRVIPFKAPPGLREVRGGDRERGGSAGLQGTVLQGRQGRFGNLFRKAGYVTM